MRSVSALIVVTGICSFTSLAFGANEVALPPVQQAAPPQVLQPAPPPPKEAAQPVAQPEGPPARTGFQAAFRTGFSFPMGDASNVAADTLGRRYAWQVPVAIDLGAKVTRSVFVGGYLHLGFGSEGSDSAVTGFCDDNDSNLENDVSCSVVTIRLGVEGHYQFQPDGRVNPWVGYGLGFESAVQSLTDRQHGYSETNTSSGFTYAQISGGFDLRSAVGIGPFGELALGQFTKGTTEQNGRKVFSGSIDDPVWHAWLTIGLRLVVRP